MTSEQSNTQANKKHAKKGVGNDIVKLRLFSFSLRAYEIDSWNKCKDAFISKYFPPAKIISLRNDIMKFE